jgi:transcription elongation factor Elf1
LIQNLTVHFVVLVNLLSANCRLKFKKRNKKTMIGYVACKVCGQKFETNIIGKHLFVIIEN